MNMTDTLPTDLRVAVRDLAPEDKLDKRQRRRDELDPGELAELKQRRLACVRAGYNVARQYAGARPEVLEVAKAFFTEPSAKDKDKKGEKLYGNKKAVEMFLGSSDLVTLVRAKISAAKKAALTARINAGKEVGEEEWEGALVPRAQLGSKTRQAEYHLLLACFCPWASDSAGSLRTIAYAGAAQYEKSQNPPRPGGWGHPFVLGLINAERR